MAMSKPTGKQLESFQPINSRLEKASIKQILTIDTSIKVNQNCNTSTNRSIATILNQLVDTRQ